MPEQSNIEPFKIPKVFISYSWTSKEHAQWVLEFATSLVDNGIDIIIDKWDLPEGEDKYKFMERIVNDKSVDKVIILSDKRYAEKADKREGGVGSETQIISVNLYEQFSEGEQNNRFVALACEKDNKGKPYLPTYYKNRIYIDFSDNDLRSTNFEHIIRWIFNKPLYKKPLIGKPPHYILQEDSISLGTQGKLKGLLDSFSHNSSIIKGALIDYLDTFSSNIERFKLDYNKEEDFYKLVVNNVKQFLPFRNEFIDVAIHSVNYLDEEILFQIYHKFFEDILKLILRPKFSNTSSDFSRDNYKYIILELFLYFNAVLLKNQKFNLFNEMLKNFFYITDTDDFDTGLYPYIVFNLNIESFYYASKKNQRISFTADRLIANANYTRINLTDLMQADFILFILSEILLTPKYFNWSPKTGVYIASRQPKFELFLRSESESFFNNFKICLGINSLEELKKLAEQFHSRERSYPEYFTESLYPPSYMNINNLCMRD